MAFAVNDPSTARDGSAWISRSIFFWGFGSKGGSRSVRPEFVSVGSSAFFAVIQRRDRARAKDVAPAEMAASPQYDAFSGPVQAWGRSSGERAAPAFRKPC